MNLKATASSYSSGKTGVFFVVSAAILVALAEFLPTPAGVAQLLLGAIVVFRARPTELPAFMILLVGTHGFSYSPGIEQSDSLLESGLSVHLFRVLSVPLIATKVCIDLVLGSSAFLKTRFGHWLMMAWLIGLPLVLIESYLGWELTNESWSRAIRYYCVVLTFPYGFEMARRWTSRASPTLGLIIQVINIAIFLELYWSHFGFFSLALAVPLFWISITHKLSVAAIISGFGVLCMIWYLSTVSVALGISLTLFFPAIIVLLGSLGSAVRTVVFSTKTWAVGVLTIVLFVGLSIYLSDGAQAVYETGDSHFRQRLIDKSLGDRGPLWFAALQQVVTEPPYFIVPAGRALILQSGNDTIRWSVGSHNTGLEVLRQMGGAAGSLCLVLLLLVWRRGWCAGAEKLPLDLRCVFAATSGAAFGGMLIGDYVVDSYAGVWVWGGLGLCAGAASELRLQRSLLPSVRVAPVPLNRRRPTRMRPRGIR